MAFYSIIYVEIYWRASVRSLVTFHQSNIRSIDGPIRQPIIPINSVFEYYNYENVTSKVKVTHTNILRFVDYWNISKFTSLCIFVRETRKLQDCVTCCMMNVTAYVSLYSKWQVYGFILMTSHSFQVKVQWSNLLRRDLWYTRYNHDVTSFPLASPCLNLIKYSCLICHQVFYTFKIVNVDTFSLLY